MFMFVEMWQHVQFQAVMSAWEGSFIEVFAMSHVQGVLVSPRMVQDHLPASLLRSLKAVTQRLAQEEGKSGKEYRQFSTVDKQSSGQGSMEEKNEIVRLDEAASSSVFDLV